MNSWGPNLPFYLQGKNIILLHKPEFQRGHKYDARSAAFIYHN